jgi:protein-S-isoprenylcysteine O-methyltransferase Ste14
MAGEKETKARPSTRSLVSRIPSSLVSLVTLALLLGALWQWQRLSAGRWIWLGAFMLAMAIRAPYLKRNRANRNHRQAGRMRDCLPAFVLVATLTLPFLHLATGGPAALNYHLPMPFVVAGGLLQLPYLWLFYRAHADLERNWSPGLEIREGHVLVEHGVYSHIRHPMYAAVWLSALAQPLLIQNWLAGPPVLLAIAVFWFLRVPAEERMMAAHFGAAYETYRGRTGRLLPVRRHG